MTHRVSQQRNRNYEKEPNGKSRPTETIQSEEQKEK